MAEFLSCFVALVSCIGYTIAASSVVVGTRRCVYNAARPGQAERNEVDFMPRKIGWLSALIAVCLLGSGGLQHAHRLFAHISGPSHSASFDQSCSVEGGCDSPTIPAEDQPTHEPSDCSVCVLLALSISLAPDGSAAIGTPLTPDVVAADTAQRAAVEPVLPGGGSRAPPFVSFM